MLNIDASDFINDLEEYKLQLKLALENAVREFSIDIVRQIIPYTPYGDSRVFYGLYQLRHEMNSSYPLDEGMTIANWSISVKREDSSVDYTADSLQGSYAISKGYRTVAAYNLGDTVYIQNNVPYGSYMKGEQPEILYNYLKGMTVSAAKFKDNLVAN